MGRGSKKGEKLESDKKNKQEIKDGFPTFFSIDKYTRIISYSKLKQKHKNHIKFIYLFIIENFF